MEEGILVSNFSPFSHILEDECCLACWDDISDGTSKSDLMKCTDMFSLTRKSLFVQSGRRQEKGFQVLFSMRKGTDRGILCAMEQKCAGG